MKNTTTTKPNEGVLLNTTQWYTGTMPANKRIHNPTTGKYYRIRQKTTSQGKKGQIMGVYKTEGLSSGQTTKKYFGDVLKKLSKE